MQYYRRNLGDYAKKTGRLSILQHGVYNLLIDACYDRETFPTRGEAIDWVWASTTEEIEATDFILKRFFVLQDDGTYVQDRILEELQEYWAYCEKQAENGKKGGRPKKPNGKNKKPTGLFKEPTGNPLATQKGPEKRLTTNHYPLTTNQESKTLGGSGEPPKWDRAAPTFDEFWEIYPRKDKKQDAFKAWNKRIAGTDLPEVLMADVRARLATKTWITDGPDRQYIPHPTTYLNGSRWTDEILPRSEHASTQGHTQHSDTRRLSGAERTRLAREQQRQRELDRLRSPIGSPDVGCVG